MTSSELNEGLQLAIKHLREQTGIGVVVFCESVGVNGVCEYEKGRRSVSVRVINRYAQYFNMRASDVVKLAEDLYALRHNKE